MKFRRIIRPISANFKDEREVIFLELIITIICSGFAFVSREAEIGLIYYPMLLLTICCFLSACYHIILLFMHNHNEDSD